LYAASAVDIVLIPHPDQSSSPISRAATDFARSAGTIPLQSKWPVFEQCESTGRFSASSASA
jgi:hypothetical protein